MSQQPVSPRPQRFWVFLLLISFALSARATWHLARLEASLDQPEPAGETQVVKPPPVEDPELVRRVEQLENTVEQAWQHAQQAQALMDDGSYIEAEREVDRVARELRRAMAEIERRDKLGRLKLTPPGGSGDSSSGGVIQGWGDSVKRLLQDRVRRAEERKTD